MSHAEVDVEHDPIDAIVAAAQQILTESAQSVHGRQVTRALSPPSNCPARGHFFATPSAKKRRSYGFAPQFWLCKVDDTRPRGWPHSAAAAATTLRDGRPFVGIPGAS